MTVNRATPNTSAAIYKAAALIDEKGPQTIDDLFFEVNFGVQNDRMNKLQRAFDIGWLYETPVGTVDLTESTKRHFDRKRPSDYVGQITPAQYRPNIYASQGLSKKNIPNSRGMRNDIPNWSVRETVSIKTIGGGGA